MMGGREVIREIGRPNLLQDPDPLGILPEIKPPTSKMATA